MKSLSYRFDLISHLARRSFVLRYEGSALGVLWSLLLPLFQLLVLVFLFGKVVPLNIEGYPAFVFSALLPWNWFSGCLGSASYLFISNRDLVRQPDFEPANLIFVEALSHLFVYLASLPILVAVLLASGRTATESIVLLPLLMLIEFVLIAGLGFIFATLNVFYRDVAHLVGVALTLLFYLTPVFYQSEAVGGSYRFLYTINPMAVLVKSYRAIFFYGTFPEWDSLALAAIVSSAILALGFLVYKRRSNEMIDIL